MRGMSGMEVGGTQQTQQDKKKQGQVVKYQGKFNK